MINKLILGTVQLGLDYGINNYNGKPSLEKSFEILKTAFDNNIRILDTAEAYGNSQEVIGKFHKTFPDKKFQVITKLSASTSIKPHNLINHILENCRMLSVDKLYGYMFHNYDSLKKESEFYNKLVKAKSEKIVQKIGVSLYSNDQIIDVVDNYKDFDFIQIPFNLFDNEYQRKEALIKAKEVGLEIHTRSVFLQGLFFKEVNTLSKRISPLTSRLIELGKIITDNKISIEVLALQYVLQKEYINQVLIGVETTEQLKQNLEVCSRKYNIPNHLIDNIKIKETKLLNPSNWNL